MKNVLVYVHPDMCFDSLNEKLVKLQIENSLELGWDRGDMILITNFPCKYMGVSSHVVEDGYCSFKDTATKTTTICHLFKDDFFKDDIYWAHDLDAFQSEYFSERDLDLDYYDGGFNTYCRNTCWQMGSFFFKKELKDIFEEILERLKPDIWKVGGPTAEEFVMGLLTDENFNNINYRIKVMNTTYDFGMRRIKQCYEVADKPLKVIHFRPYNDQMDTLARAMYGKNEIGKPLMSERLIKIFERYGIK